MSLLIKKIYCVRSLPLVLLLILSEIVPLAYAENNATSISANVTLASDYVWRGYSQTDGDPAISGGFDYTDTSGFYAGIWGSNVGFAADTDLELDVYAGFSMAQDNGVTWDIGILRYNYPGTSISGDIDWNEYHISASYGIASASINYTNNVYGTDTTAIYYTIALEYNLPHEWTLTTGINLYDYDASLVTGSVIDYHLGIAKEFAGLGVDISYYDTNSTAANFYGTNIADGRVVLSLSKEF